MNEQLRLADAGLRFVYPADQDMLVLLTKHKREDPPPDLRPPLPSSPCHCNCAYSPDDYVHAADVHVHHPAPHCTAFCTLFDLHCPQRNEQCRIVFDAHVAKHQGYFLHAGHLISLEFMYNLADDFAKSGKAMQTFVDEVDSAYARCHPPPTLPFVPLNTFRTAFTSFMGCIDQDFSFVCPSCGPNPTIIIGDATSCTIKTAFYHGRPITTPSLDEPLERHPANTRRERAAIPDSSIRAALREYAGDIRREQGVLRPSAALRTAAQPPWLPGMVKVVELILTHAARWGPAALLEAREQMAWFVGAMGSDSPVAAYLPPQAADRLSRLLPKVALGELGEALAVVRDDAPIISDLLRLVASAAGPSHPHQPLLGPPHFLLIRNTLDSLALKSSFLMQAGGAGNPLPIPEPATSSNPQACASTGMCCGLPRVRNRYPTYADPAQTSGEGGDCRHMFVKPGGRTGGIFTWFCKHGICYAFHIIDKVEGRNEPYSFLVSHFECPPEAVVYDFSCKLHEYCLNRAPSFFANTTFAIDRFHQHNHTSCAAAYRLDTNPHRFAGVNSSIAEQCNSLIGKVKGAISASRQSTAMLLLRFYLACNNTRKRNTLAVQNRHRNEQVRQ